jgi:hypothetical protein
VATTLSDYALLLRKTNRKSQAREMANRANRIREKDQAAKLASQAIHAKTLMNAAGQRQRDLD